MDIYAFSVDWLRGHFAGLELRDNGKVLYREPGTGGGGPNGSAASRRRRWLETS